MILFGSVSPQTHDVYTTLLGLRLIRTGVGGVVCVIVQMDQKLDKRDGLLVSNHKHGNLL